MYNFKEKSKLLRELHNPEFAAEDLELLQHVSPQNDLLRSPIVNVARSAEKILYALLDCTTSEQIRLNRRACIEKQEPEKELEDDPSKGKIPENTGEEKPVGKSGEESPGSQSDNKDRSPGKDDVGEKHEEVHEDIDVEKKSEIRNQMPEPELDPENSQKSPNTPESTGQTSSTKMSK